MELAFTTTPIVAVPDARAWLQALAHRLIARYPDRPVQQGRVGAGLLYLGWQEPVDHGPPVVIWLSAHRTGVALTIGRLAALRPLGEDAPCDHQDQITAARRILAPYLDPGATPITRQINYG